MTRQFGIAVHEFEYAPYQRERPATPLQRYVNDLHCRIRDLVSSGDRAEYQRLKSLVDGISAMGRAYQRTARGRETLGGSLDELYSFMARSAPPASIRAAGGDRVLSFIASTPSLDRHGSVIKSEGISTENYMKDPVVVFGHDAYGSYFSTPDPANVIGRTIRLRKSPRALEADVEFLPASVNPRAEMIFGMLQTGALTSMSIGFIPKRITVALVDGLEIPTIEESELLELSIVPVPSNVDAVVQK